VRQSAVDDCFGVLSHFGVPAGGTVIDVGGTETVCLDGRPERNPLLERHPGLVLLDGGYTQQALGTTAHTEADFLDGSLIEAIEQAFDLVYCFDTLEHVSNPFLFSQHLLAITKPGGHIYVATVFEWMYHPSPEDYFRFSPSGLRELFRNPLNGLRDECTVLWHGWGTDPKGTALLARREPAAARRGGAPATVCASVPELLG
jgi:SAM-dependent methyltransferase